MSEVTINFSFTDIQIISKSLAYLPPAIDEELKYSYQIIADSKVDANKGLVLIVVIANVHNEKSQQLASMTAIFTFALPDFNTHIRKLSDTLYDVPDQLNSMFKQVSVSTMRGLMYTELKSTYLHNAIMPVVFPDMSVKEELPTPSEENKTEKTKV